MAVLPILKAGNPVLKQVATPVEFVNKKMRQLLDDMKETMYASDGCGLAAPQIGVSQRLIVLDDGNGFQEFINPVIVRKSGTQQSLEGCLSVPGIFGDVERYESVEVHAINRNNKKFVVKASGFLACILQHEIDHLDGVLFVEKVTNAYTPKKENEELVGDIHE